MSMPDARRTATDFLAARVGYHQAGERERLLRLAEGRADLISLGRGDPDLPTPPHIVEAARRALEGGATHYTHWQGREDLRQAICNKYRRQYGVQIDPSQVVVTAGAQEAIYITFQTLLDPGDEVLLADPHYLPYTRAIRLAGGLPVYVRTLEEHGFVMQPEDVVGSITPRTKALVVISPGNPTGAVIPAQVMAELAAVAHRHDLLVVMDEIYEKFVFDGAVHSTIAAEPGMMDRTIIVNGFSKTYAMTGWRVGYLIAPGPIVPPMAMVKHTMTICAPAVSQAAALAALEGPQGVVEEMRQVYSGRRRVLVEELMRLGLNCGGSRGALFAYANVTSTGVTAFDLCARLLDVGVLVFPGTAFGNGEGYVRASFLQPSERLQEAIDRIGPVVRKLQHRRRKTEFG
ncbi:MAG: pyridoxal phosphate-dependent aminotransferase [Armatimonadota bacterium]|nr:pyridoxal phosphate-dependent aminotransferase [Armatimonadota bacterium]